MNLDTDKVIKEVWICERKYTMSMLKNEEESFDHVMKTVDAKLKELRSKFPNKDEKDFLAMTLIQVATRNISTEESEMDIMEVESKVQHLIQVMEQALTSNEELPL